MAIHQAALDRFKGATFTVDTFVRVFEQINAAYDEFGPVFDIDKLILPLDYQKDGEEVKPDELIPVITIGLRRPTQPDFPVLPREDG